MGHDLNTFNYEKTGDIALLVHRNTSTKACMHMAMTNVLSLV